MKNISLKRRECFQMILSLGTYFVFSKPAQLFMPIFTDWDLSHVTELKPGSVLDLSTTLPIYVAKGGTFSLDLASEELPQGVTLSPSGILHVSESFNGKLDGLIFSYDDQVA